MNNTIIYNNVPCLVLKKGKLCDFEMNDQFLIFHKNEIIWVFYTPGLCNIIYYDNLKQWAKLENSNLIKII